MATGILSFSKKVDLLARFCLVYVLLCAFILLDMISFDVSLFTEMRPAFTLMCLFYWSVFRPSLMPVWLAFVIGLLIDSVAGLPLGLNALIFVIVSRAVQTQRKLFMGQNFMTVYFGFTVIAVAAGMLQWGVFSLVAFHMAPPMPVIGSTVLGLAFFPFAFLLMHAVHKILPMD